MTEELFGANNDAFDDDDDTWDSFYTADSFLDHDAIWTLRGMIRDRIIDSMNVRQLFNVPGVGEAVSAHFNTEIDRTIRDKYGLYLEWAKDKVTGEYICIPEGESRAFVPASQYTIVVPEDLDVLGAGTTLIDVIKAQFTDQEGGNFYNIWEVRADGSARYIGPHGNPIGGWINLEKPEPIP